MRPTTTNTSVRDTYPLTTTQNHTPQTYQDTSQTSYHSPLTVGSDSRISTPGSIAPPPPTTLNPTSATLRQHQLGSPDKQRQHTLCAGGIEWWRLANCHSKIRSSFGHHHQGFWAGCQCYKQRVSATAVSYTKPAYRRTALEHINSNYNRIIDASSRSLHNHQQSPTHSITGAPCQARQCLVPSHQLHDGKKIHKPQNMCMTNTTNAK